VQRVTCAKACGVLIGETCGDTELRTCHRQDCEGILSEPGKLCQRRSTMRSFNLPGL
jgi:hypothetical protein